ncbi:hypothetical protein OXYTRIMIC_234 [Oxytricha trifallax]|uniref:Uncharacterized protein n=1 Tax=Oxytricha trifallax TaxID=1172189 RepID=A0A073HZI7_9SPIT|nr:hypothetical protein OXYTRIMIC_234 [Oxytricha trifallax]
MKSNKIIFRIAQKKKRFVDMIQYKKQTIVKRFHKIAFTKSKYNDVVETFKKMKLYSPELKPLDKNDVFKEQLWHPGKIDQSLNACLIHAVNLMVGGPLFDVSSKFTQLYISRVHMTKQRQAEMHWEHGYSLKNLKHIIYDSRKKIWLSPKMIDMITGQRLRELKDNEKGGLYNYLNSIKQENRFFFQMKSENKIQQNGQLVTISELNAGVIAKVEGDWYILDSAENDKIQVTVDNRAANDWLDGVEYLGLSILEKDNPQKEKMESFLREWELILDGICIYKRKPRALKSKRRMSRKSDRKNLDRKGSRQYRCPTSEPAKPKLRKSREIQLLGKRTDSRRKIDLKAVNYLITEKAREKRWQQKKENLDILSKSEDQHLKKLKACKNELETMQNYRQMLKKFDHLPTKINLKAQIKAPAEEETILLIAWKWQVITSKSCKLVQIKDDCSDFPKMQKRMENQLTNYIKKLYKNCHLLPIEIMDCLMRDSSLENKEHLAKWFKIQVEDKLQKHGDPRETCKPLIKVVDEIRQLF